MGKGDKKTKKGKISMGSYGVRRPKKDKKYVAPEPVKEVKKKDVVVDANIATEDKPKKAKKVAAPKDEAAEEKSATKKTTKKAKE
jgi:30S ribosomal protein S31